MAPVIQTKNNDALNMPFQSFTRYTQIHKCYPTSARFPPQWFERAQMGRVFVYPKESAGFKYVDGWNSIFSTAAM